MDTPRKILLTTSRIPTPRIRTFCRDLTRVMPNIEYVNRGKMSETQMSEKALEFNAEYVAVVERWQGNPDKIEFFSPSSDGLIPVPPILHIASIRLQREFTSKKIKPVQSIAIANPVDDSVEITDSLSKIFNIPVLSEKEASTKYPFVMHISHDANQRVQMTFKQLSQKVETGPRVTLKQIKGKTNK